MANAKAQSSNKSIKVTLVKSYNDQIADWDVRLQARRQGLQKQFADLEVALGKMKDQSSWLSGQLASLPTGK